MDRGGWVLYDADVYIWYDEHNRSTPVILGDTPAPGILIEYNWMDIIGLRVP